jgi:acyl-CoA thioester hydrolase
VTTPFRTRRRVEFGDTDMAGIVHFANFFRYMEVAETDFLHALGLSVSWQTDHERRGFPRVSVGCDFVKPARFEDILDIDVVVEEVGKKSIRYRFDFSCRGERIATGRITTVYCRSTPGHGIESMSIPDDLRAKLLENRQIDSAPTPS